MNRKLIRGWGLVVVLVALCFGAVWVPPSTIWARVSGQSGTVTVSECFQPRPGFRGQWSCSGEFQPSERGSARPVTFTSRSRVPAGTRLTADAADTESIEVQPRTNAATACLLICPVLVLSAVVLTVLRPSRGTSPP